MTQAVSGVHRAWLVFSGLAFVVCGMLLVYRFGMLARSRPSERAAAAASAAPVIQEQFTVQSGSAPSAEDYDEKPAAAAPPVSAPHHQLGGQNGKSGKSAKSAKSAKSGKSAKSKPAEPSEKSDQSDKSEPKSGKAGARPTSGAHAPRPPAARPGPSRGLEINSGALGAGHESAPRPSSDDLLPGSAPSPPPPHRAKSAPPGDTKPGRGKAKRHNPPPSKDDDDPEGKSPGAAAAASRAEKLTEGVLKVNAPAAMTVGESEHVRAVIGTKTRADAVEKEASNDVGEGPRVQLGRELMLSPLVRMELRADVPGDFDITAFVPQAEQRLSDGETTVWDWAIQPKHEGLRGLTLIVTDLRETSREPIRTKTYPVHIEVRVATYQRVHDVAVSVSSVLSGLAGLIGAWLGLLRPLLQRRRPEGEAGTGAPRPPHTGAPPHPPGGTGTTLRPGTDTPSAGSPPHQQ